MATAQNVIDASIARRKDPYQNSWEDAELLDYLQAGVNFVHPILVKEESELIQTTATIAMTALAGQEYDLPASFLAVAPDGVWITGYDPMRPVRVNEKIANGTSTGASADITKYYVTVDKIGFVKIPNASITANIRYFTTATTLVVGTTMPYSGIFNDALSMFMTNMAFARNDSNLADIGALYNALESSALTIIRRRIPLRPGVAKQAQ